MDNRIFVYGLSRRPSLRKKVEKITHIVLGYFNLRTKTLDITFLGNREMVLLKRRYLKKKTGPANTLSFEPGVRFPEPKGFPEALGEVLINTDLTEHKIQKISPLLIHSILHLLGYHHEKERDKIEMDRLTDSVIKALER
ncbi:MAG: rRNA maturation RNase YbeY [Patescibacteria group bacterium]